MKIRMSVIFLVFALCLSLLSGCDVVGEIAGNVADAAMKELENQIKSTVEEYKVDVVEVKSAVGKLNNASDSDLQFFCGVLVRSNSNALPEGGADAVGKLFEQSGIQPQNGSEIRSELLTNKSISFKHTVFSDGDYYLIWVYTSSLTQKLKDLELPTLPADWLPAEGTKAEG